MSGSGRAKSKDDPGICPSRGNSLNMRLHGFARECLQEVKAGNTLSCTTAEGGIER